MRKVIRLIVANILVIGAGGVGGGMASIAETRSFFDSFSLTQNFSFLFFIFVF